MYHENATKETCLTVSIDATGSLVKPATLIGGWKKKMFLYETVFNDKATCLQLSVGHMLSERYDNNSIDHSS